VKNRGTAILLALFFGPPGLFYASPAGAVLMTAAAIGVVFIWGWAYLAIVWPVCLLWAFMALTFRNHTSRPRRRLI